VRLEIGTFVVLLNIEDVTNLSELLLSSSSPPY